MAGDSCRFCTAGVPIVIAEDENGQTLHCFNCSHQWTEPAAKAEQRAELVDVHQHASLADRRALARAQGIDPDEHVEPESLQQQLIDSAPKDKGAAGAGSSSSSSSGGSSSGGGS